MTDCPSDTPLRCSVAGGSLVGLSTAIALSRLGFAVTVEERSPARAVDGGGGLGDIPAHGVGRLLNADPLVSGWTGVYFSTLEIDGANVPVMGGSPDAAVGPPPLSGRSRPPA